MYLQADMKVAEMERVLEQRLDQCKEESRQNSARMQEEHAALVRFKM